MHGLKTIVTVSDHEYLELEKIIKSHNAAQKLVRRSRIITMASDGVRYNQIAKELKIQPKVVTTWTQRWVNTSKKGLTAIDRLSDLPRPGAPDTFTPEQVCQMIAIACEQPSVYDRPITHWTGRELADEAIKLKIVDSISERHMNRLLEKLDLRPHKSQYWLNGKPDSRKDEKIRAICQKYKEAPDMEKKTN